MSGPRVKMAPSSAGVTTPDPGAEGIVSSEKPFGCARPDGPRDRVEGCGMTVGAAPPLSDSRAASNVSMSDHQSPLHERCERYDLL